jgi:hypothetical protein
MFEISNHTHYGLGFQNSTKSNTLFKFIINQSIFKKSNSREVNARMQFGVFMLNINPNIVSSILMGPIIYFKIHQNRKIYVGICKIYSF